MSFMDYWKKFTNTEDDDDFEEVVQEDAPEAFETKPFSSVSSYDDYERETPRVSSRTRRNASAEKRWCFFKGDYRESGGKDSA